MYKQATVDDHRGGIRWIASDLTVEHNMYIKVGAQYSVG